MGSPYLKKGLFKVIFGLLARFQWSLESFVVKTMTLLCVFMCNVMQRTGLKNFKRFNERLIALD